MFKKIGFSIKPSATGAETWYQLSRHLNQHYSDCQLYLEQQNLDHIRHYLSRHQLQHLTLIKGSLKDWIVKLDLMISIGGDGTLIALAQHAPQHQLPVLGINLGRLGYLTDITPTRLMLEMDQVMQGNYWIDKRLMLSATIANHQETLSAVNEICFSKASGTGIVDLEVSVDQRFLVRQRSDGLIVNTATGSTAYALSAGGSIISSQTHAICITPVSPHTLSYRPLVISDDCQIKVQVHDSVNNPTLCCADGLKAINLSEDQPVTIKKSQQFLSLVHPNSYNEFETLRSKLGWG